MRRYLETPNAGAHLPPEAEAQRTLAAVRCSALFGPVLVKDIGFPCCLPQIASLTTAQSRGCMACLTRKHCLVHLTSPIAPALPALLAACPVQRPCRYD